MFYKSKDRSKTITAKVKEGAEIASFRIRELLQLQERMFKNIVESIDSKSNYKG